MNQGRKLSLDRNWQNAKKAFIRILKSRNGPYLSDSLSIEKEFHDYYREILEGKDPFDPKTFFMILQQIVAIILSKFPIKQELALKEKLPKVNLIWQLVKFGVKLPPARTGLRARSSGIFTQDFQNFFCKRQTKRYYKANVTEKR